MNVACAQAKVASPATMGKERSFAFWIKPSKYRNLGTISHVQRHSGSRVPLDVEIFSEDANYQYARQPTTVASIAADVLALRHSCPDQTQGKGKT